MGWGDTDYTSAATVKTALTISDSTDDALLAATVTAVSREIDSFTNRQFGVVASSAARVYDATTPGQLLIPIDDLQTVTDLAVVRAAKPGDTFDVTLVKDTDFELWPPNAAGEGDVWTHINLFSAPSGTPRYKVTGVWGWTAVPTSIERAAFLQTLRLFKRRDAPFGVAGSPDIGSEVRLLDRLDPDVQVLVRKYRRPARAH